MFLLGLYRLRELDVAMINSSDDEEEESLVKCPLMECTGELAGKRVLL